ncbi:MULTISPECIES: NADH-quinone oxidoreductase subunit L [unclassified Roseitalea]|uniref:NADH-quinone oxidoreductase subunit L n=1 Tax=unclassified Roseitalea TaxID=2639107 RepID=UPI00273E8E29|nr:MULTISPECIES: NADH-quinone oxidoreductase subunit L [unclassified Roseitalea]
MYHAIVFLPLLGALIAGFGGRAIGAKASEYVTSGFLILAAILSWIALITVGFSDAEPRIVQVARFMASGNLQVDWAFRIDTLTVVMLVVVNTVSALVHVYSIGYMHHDPHRPRFFAYLSLFTFAMLMLVTADNLVQLFFGWEGVGLASYLLIGFWYKKASANNAAMKAFIVNRVGDFGFLLGIFGVFVLFGSVDFDTIFAGAAAFAPVAGEPSQTAQEVVLTFLGYELNRQDALTVVCLLLFLGAMGKSAQFLLHTWLPDAMEGPTPVSALIHAATMVTAGVFMVARLSPIFEFSLTALTVITVVGATTAFFAATVGLVQNDIKRVIAYSTCSQLGYMFVALGVGAYGAAMYHLFTHAFFKALLFLGAGSVIHAVSDEQDMRKMGGLRKHIPVTYWMMIIGTVALTGLGIPGTYIGTAGFFSKDAIIESAFVGRNVAADYAFGLLLIAAVFTAFYSWRLIFMTFHGRPRATADVMHHVHESPQVMLIPLYILAAGSLLAGFFFYSSFVGYYGDQEGWYNDFFRTALFAGPDNTILDDFHEVPYWVKASPAIAMLIGLGTAWYMYIRAPEMPAALARQHSGLYRFLLNKWYFDELYDFLFVRPARRLGTFLWKRGDGWLIDGFGPDGIARRVTDVTGRVVRWQSGYVYHYAFAMMIGLAALITWITLGGAL